MAVTKKQITDSLRTQWVKTFKEFLEQTCNTDVCQTAAGTLMFPVVDAAGEDRWVKLSVIIPKDATEEDGTDGYSLAQEYDLKLQAAVDRKEKAAKAAEARKAKAKAKEAE